MYRKLNSVLSRNFLIISQGYSILIQLFGGCWFEFEKRGCYVMIKRQEHFRVVKMVL